MWIGKRIIFAAACARIVMFATAALMPHGVVAAANVKTPDFADTLAGPAMKRVTTFVAAIKAAGLVDVLHGSGSFTLFEPTNEAFQKLPPGTLNELLQPQNKEKLRSLLFHHLHRGDAITIAQIRTMNVSALDGPPLMLKLHDGNVWVNDAKLVKNDVICGNGVIHRIDNVMLP